MELEKASNAPRGSLAGIGLGLREQIAEDTLTGRGASLAFVEIHPENFEGRGGVHETLFERAAAKLPILTHGLTLGVGSAERPSRSRLSALRTLINRTKAPFHSEHLAFGPIAGHHSHDLLPIPWTKASLSTCIERIRELEGTLELPIAVENISYYAIHEDSEMSELEFLDALFEKTNVRLLLDVNNTYVNSRNHAFDAAAWLKNVPADRVAGIHVAGHFERTDGWLIDTHGDTVRQDVLTLLEQTLVRTGPVPVLLERDTEFSDAEAIWADVERLRTTYDRAMATR
jgi:uncharacterized protein